MRFVRDRAVDAAIDAPFALKRLGLSAYYSHGEYLAMMSSGPRSTS
jgi:hypothetical protein